ncbi:MAG: leucine-rich repeat domain-containing protein [Lachnospiraceae bacterium]|nr:leucine-rich repeat domain-containing protein [Lachnospiraceae bacterium]
MQFKVTDAVKKTVIVTKGENKKAKSVKIPATVTVNNVQCEVVEIAANAFKGYTKLKKAVIGDNVVKIGKTAFSGCKNLTTVTIGKKVTSIEAKCFFNCKKLRKAVFKGAGVKTIKSKAFKGTKANIRVSFPKAMKAKQKKKMKTMLKKAGISRKAVIK